VNREATTGAGESAGAGATCSWTRRIWSSEQRFTAPRYRPIRHHVATGGRSRSPSAPLPSVSGCRLPGQRQGVDKTGAWYECRGCASYGKADIGEVSKDLGRGAGKGGPRDLLAEAASTSRLRDSAETLGRGTYLLVAESQNGRLSKDHERLCATSEAFVYAAMIRLTVRRLARPEIYQTVSLGAL
jgi:hypothetical protein